MAVDLCSGNSSPRISFSHDLHNNDDIVRIESSPHGLDYPDFNFCTSDSTKNEASSAEELFSNGVILPLQLQERFVTSRVTSSSLPPLPISSTSKTSKPETVEFEQKYQSKSFWGMKRSSSVHCDNSYKKSSFWSIPLLKRSNSTGSAKDQRQQKRNLLKEPRNSSTATNSFYAYSMSQKPPLKKNYGNAGKISPVINVGTANLFGLGSFFGNGKDKKNRK